MNAQTLTLAEQISTGIWDVFCMRCKTSIGTMNVETMTKAIDWAKNRGGVMCPSCRNQVCNECSGELEVWNYGQWENCTGCFESKLETNGLINSDDSDGIQAETGQPTLSSFSNLNRLENDRDFVGKKWRKNGEPKDHTKGCDCNVCIFNRAVVLAGMKELQVVPEMMREVSERDER